MDVAGERLEAGGRTRRAAPGPVSPVRLRPWRLPLTRRPAARPRPGRRRGESGGAVSLWVVLMVPVSAFAAVVAMAGPQRLAAESSVREAADDMATMAVAWRYSHQQPDGQIPAYFLECDHHSPEQTTELARLAADVKAAEERAEQAQAAVPVVQAELEGAQIALGDARRAQEVEKARLDAWKRACGLLSDSIIRDLGNLGVDMGSLRGSYSDSVASYSDLLDPADGLPCKISPRLQVQDAVHVALAADWAHAGWAAAQVWPDGTRMGAESIGRRSRAVEDSDLTDCDGHLDVLDDQGRPVVLSNRDAGSRKLAQSSPTRTAFSG